MSSLNGSRRIRRAGWLIIALAWLVAFAACELFARRFGGFVLVDGRPAAMERHEEFGELRLETLGGVAIWWRDHPDRPLPAPEKMGFRIVVLGDSVLLPALLDDQDGTARLLENELNTRLDGGPYEVVNLSEGGWNTLQEEQVLFHEGLPLSPDLVLVAVSPNDTQEFAYRDGQLLEVRFIRDLEQRPTDGLQGLLAARSYFYNLLWLRWKGSAYRAGRVREPREVEAVVEPLRRMTLRSAARGVRLAVVCLPFLFGDRFNPDTDRCSFQRTVDWAANAQVPLLDPIPTYSRYATRDLRLDQIHLSKLGHRLLARAVFDWLVEGRLVPYHSVLPAAPDGLARRNASIRAAQGCPREVGDLAQSVCAAGSSLHLGQRSESLYIANR